MKTTSLISYTMENVSKVCILYGLFTTQEASGDQVHVYVGSEAMNDAVASYLTNCDREQQERFIQALTGHIRETENVEA